MMPVITFGLQTNEFLTRQIQGYDLNKRKDYSCSAVFEVYGQPTDESFQMRREI
jgi:hypothetical protein